MLLLFTIREGNGETWIMFRYAGHFVVTLILAAALGVFVSCGNASGDGVFSYSVPQSESDISSLIPVPIRREYFVKSVFNKFDDLSVIAVYPNGDTEPVSVDKIDMSIVEGEEEIHLGMGEYSVTYTFTEAGEKIVNLEYAKQKARYAVWVRNPTNDDLPNNPTPNPDEGGTVIIINIIE
jgi:hypothetical protein